VPRAGCVQVQQRRPVRGRESQHACTPTLLAPSLSVATHLPLLPHSPQPAFIRTACRYEGEFEDNNMSGYGVYVWGAEGSVYRGQASREGTGSGLGAGSGAVGLRQRADADADGGMAAGAAGATVTAAGKAAILLHVPWQVLTAAVGKKQDGRAGAHALHCSCPAPGPSTHRSLYLLIKLQWKNSMMDGCGVKITKQPNGSYLAEEGQFVNDEWVSGRVGEWRSAVERCREGLEATRLAVAGVPCSTCASHSCCSLLSVSLALVGLCALRRWVM